MIADHIDGDFLNTRQSNLRVCTQEQNGKNRKKNKNNKSGVKGVFWNTYAPTPKWQAYIMVDYHHKSLGYYEKFEDAVEARKQAEIKYFGEYNRKLDIAIASKGKNLKTSNKYNMKPKWKTVIPNESYTTRYNGYEYIIQKNEEDRYEVIKKISSSEMLILNNNKAIQSAKRWLTIMLNKELTNKIAV